MGMAERPGREPSSLIHEMSLSTGHRVYYTAINSLYQAGMVVHTSPHGSLEGEQPVPARPLGD